MINFSGKLVVLFLILILIGCGEDDVLPDNNLPPENEAPSKFGIDVLGVFHDRGTITWGPVYDIDKDVVYQTVYLDGDIVLNRSTTDSILTIRNLKPLTEYRGKVLVTDDKNDPIEIPFSFMTRKYWLTFDRVNYGVDGNQPGGFAAASTTDGGYVIANAGQYGDKSGIYVLKIDSLGFEQWHTIHRSYRRGSNVSGTISQTSDGGFIIASRSSLLKLDANGAAVWQVLDQNEETYYYEYNFNAAVETDDHGFLVAGSMQKHGHVDGLVTKFDSKGVMQWSKEFGTEDITFGRSICRAKDGNFLILGSSLVAGSKQRSMLTSITPLGTILWSKIYDDASVYDFPEKIKATKDGGSICLSNYSDGVYGRYARVMKIDNTGVLQWEKVFKWNQYETSAFGVTELADGYVISGNNGDARPSRGLLFKITTNGDLIWKREFEPDDYLDYNWSILDVLECPDKGYFVMGNKSYVYTPAGKEIGLWLMKTNDEGYVLK